MIADKPTLHDPHGIGAHSSRRVKGSGIQVIGFNHHLPEALGPILVPPNSGLVDLAEDSARSFIFLAGPHLQLSRDLPSRPTRSI